MNPSAGKEVLEQIPVQIRNLALQAVFDELEEYNGENSEFIRGMAHGIWNVFSALQAQGASIPGPVSFYFIIYREELIKRLSMQGLSYDTGEKMKDE